MRLNELTIIEAHQKLESKEISSLELTKACIARIEETDVKIHAFLATDFDNALKQAKDADKKIAKLKTIPMLVGIPCSIKDNLITSGIETTAGSNILRGYKPLF